MMIGICGASGSGKTTLAKEFAAETGFEFCETSTSNVCKELGLDPSKAMTFDERMTLQEAILNQLRSEWQSYIGEDAVTDRTPFDLIAYLLADVNSYEALSQEQERRLESYIGSCIGAYVNFFDKIVFLPHIRSIELEPTEKARPNMTFGYRFKFEVLVLGLLNQFGVSYEEIESAALKDRVVELKGFAA